MVDIYIYVFIHERVFRTYILDFFSYVFKFFLCHDQVIFVYILHRMMNIHKTHMHTPYTFDEADD